MGKVKRGSYAYWINKRNVMIYGVIMFVVASIVSFMLLKPMSYIYCYSIISLVFLGLSIYYNKRAKNVRNVDAKWYKNIDLFNKIW